MQRQKKSMWLLLHVIVASCAREPTSPICSRYDYEERLLERVLKNELALDTALSEIMKTNAKVLDALKQLEDAKLQLKVPTIYFRARIATTLELSNNQDVVFPSLEVNEGQGYDSSTGKFTAPVSGIYMFSVQSCVSYQKYVKIEIVHKGKTLQKSSFYDVTNAPPCVTMQVSASVATGHLVWVRTTGTTNFYADPTRFNSFSGTLINL